jgi:hypothetical protein
VLDSLVAAVQDVRSHDPRDLSDHDLAEAQAVLQSQLAALEAMAARLAAEGDARDAHAADGAHSMAAWLAWQTRLPGHECTRRVRLGRALRSQPRTAAAWSAGEIATAHVSLLAGARTERTAAAFERDEAMLVGYARTLSFKRFQAALRYWAQHADPDGAESEAERQRASRRLYLSKGYDGRWFGDLVLDPVNGAIVDAELQRRCDDLYAQDRKQAQAELGRRPLPSELGRTAAQRRADALVEMAIRSATAPAGARRPAPLFSVLIGVDTFAQLCELADGTILTPGSLARSLDDAVVEAAIFDGPGRVTAISHQRTFTGALRRAIELRDRSCYHPTCEVPAPRCQVDHIVPSPQGPTTQANGRLACPHHNRQRNRPPPDDP